MPINSARTIVGLALAAGGCVAPSPGDLAIASFHAGGVTEAAATLEAELPKAAQRDRTLALLEAGLAQLDVGERTTALEHFSEAHDRLCVLSGEGAEDALKASHEESIKEFKGEPFEQELCAFYQGWLHWALGRPELAASCFAAAQLYDRSETSQSDFPLAILFETLTRRALGQERDAQHLSQRLHAVCDDPTVRGLGERAAGGDWNVVVLVESGRGPQKTGVGSREATLSFEPNWGAIASVELALGGERTTLPRLGWTWHQAIETGERVMDQINRGKAHEKNLLEDAKTRVVDGVARSWNAALEGAPEAEHEKINQHGRQVMIATGVLYLILDTAQPGADTRTWRTLPDSFHVALASLAPGEHEMTVAARGRDGAPLATHAAPVSLLVEPGSTALVRVRLFEAGGEPQIACCNVASVPKFPNVIAENH